MTTKRSRPLREYFLLDMNIVIRILILSSVIWGGAIGLLSPIFAIFVVDFIPGATIAVAGVATSIYLVTRSVAQIPIATLIDKIRGEIDDFWVLLAGSIVAALIPIFYLVIDSPLGLYVVQFVYGLADAMTGPSYMAIFTRHIDRNKIGTEWGIYFTLGDLMAAITAAIGGIFAQTAGFRPVIVAVVIVSVLGVGLRFFLRPYLKKPSLHKKG